MISAKILADSITDGGSRLVTWEWTYPRMIHAEIMTHRALSRNAASSRAIPAKRLRGMVIDNPAIPVHWGQNQAGMQASTEVDDIARAKNWWLRGRDMMAEHHADGEALGLHKQIVNRVIEPWMNITVIVSMTDHANLFHLRNHEMAEPNFRWLAAMAEEQFHEHMPTYLAKGEWHLPMIDEGDAVNLGQSPGTAISKYSEITEMLKKVSTGRCARVSYLTHDGQRDLAEDIALHDRLAATASLGADPMHASPFEHPAMAVGGRARHGNFEGWKQYRKFFPHENGPDTSVRCESCGCWAGRHVAGCSKS